MIKFQQFRVFLESEEVTKLKHLDHPEDHPLLYGKAGVRKSMGSLNAVAEGRSEVTQKVDGAPSIVVGHAKDPRDGKLKPFISTKSAFNKNPKINFTPEDIDTNHGHAPGLAQKLKAGLEHIPKVLPKKGVFQGDMMFTPEDLQKNGKATTFTPNTISYTARGPEADKINKSKVGAIFHTKYEGDLANASAEPMTKEDYSQFGQHPDVWHRSAHMEQSPLSPEDKKIFDNHMKLAEKAAKKGGDEMFSNTAIHQGEGNHLVTYINHNIRNGTSPSSDGFKEFVRGKMQKDVDKMKSDAGKAKKNSEMEGHLNHIDHNADHYDNLFDLHKHLANAKHVLINHYNSKKSDIEHHINGETADPEGFVSTTPNGMIKLVDRPKFSRQNFIAGGIKKKKAEAAE